MSETNIIRTVKNRENPYTMIARAPLNNPALSWEARGVLAYLLDKPDDWEVRFTDLVNKGPGAADRMRRILQELEAAGHVVRTRSHDSRGRLLWETLVYEVPRTPSTATDAPVLATAEPPPSRQNRHMVAPSPYAGLPSMAQPSMAQPSMVNRHIYKDGDEPNTELTKDGERESAPPPSNVIPNDELRAWLSGAVANAGLPAHAVDVAGETAKWEDAQAAGQRPTPPTPKARAADWRIWMGRAIKWAQAHPQEVATRATTQPGAQPVAPPVDLAEQRRIIAAALTRPHPGQQAGGAPLPAV